MENELNVWAIVDDKIGHQNQIYGVANSLTSNFIQKKIIYKKSSRLPNFLKLSKLNGINLKESDDFIKPIKNGELPDVVIGAGRKTAPIVLYIKNLVRRKNKRHKCLAIQLMNPKYKNRKFDMIFVPKHDRVFKRKNIHQTLGAPNLITPEALAREGRIWERTFGSLKKPTIAILVGGDVKKKEFLPKKAEKLVKYVNAITKKYDSSILVSNSRRSSNALTDYLYKNLNNIAFFHDSIEGKGNPYFGFLDKADVIIATGDSVSMCSESCETGKLVFVYTPHFLCPKKHIRFHKHLFYGKHAFPLNSSKKAIKLIKDYMDENLIIKKLRTNGEIAEKINEKLFS